jgi:hypothetical protein
MNVVRIIFDLIATPRPLWLPLAEHETMLAEGQQWHKMLQAEEPQQDPAFSFATFAPRKSPFTFGGGPAVPGFGFGPKQPAQPAQQAGGFTFGAAQPAQGQPAFTFGTGGPQVTQAVATPPNADKDEDDDL